MLVDGFKNHVADFGIHADRGARANGISRVDYKQKSQELPMTCGPLKRRRGRAASGGDSSSRSRRTALREEQAQQPA
jgi:hypothetical protein